MTVVVTGASSGIGAATARRLHTMGAEVVLSGRNEERLRAVAEDCGGARMVVGDLALPGVADNLFYDVPDGALHAVFAAGSASFGPTLDVSDESWRTALDTNLTAMFFCCRAAIRAMLPRGGGRIVNVLSIAAKHPFPQSVSYVATKAGALGLTRSLQNEFRAQGIAVTAFLPGSVATELWDQQAWAPDTADMLDPNDVAAAIADIVLRDGAGSFDEVVFMPPKGIL